MSERWVILYTRLYGACKKPGLSPLVRATACIQLLATGVGADTVDPYLQIVALESLCDNLNTIFGDEFLRRPNQDDVQRLLAENKERGFPGMLGFLDCMHWQWDTWPVVFHGAYTGRSKHASFVLEAVASYDLWIWHASIGHPGSSSSLDILHIAFNSEYTLIINGHLSAVWDNQPYRNELKRNQRGVV